MNDADPQRWAAAADGWRKLGADMVMLYPMYRLPKFEDQIETLRRIQGSGSGIGWHRYYQLRKGLHRW